MRKNVDLVNNIQKALREFDVPAWLFYGFHNIDPIAHRILSFETQKFATRRWFYLVPAHGEPEKLVHRIESTILDHLPGTKSLYLQWQQLHAGLQSLLAKTSTVAMQHTDKNAIPYISRVDAGTVELVRSCGPTVVSSGDLAQRFEAVWTDGQVAQHRDTAQALTSIVESAFEWAAANIRAGGHSGEMEVQRFILDRFSDRGLHTDHPPIVAVNENSANPHYEPTQQHNSQIREDDFLLIDLWAKTPGEDAVYADITWVAFFGKQLPEKVVELFDIVSRARDRGVEFLGGRFQAGDFPQGWEVDDAVRAVIEGAGYGDDFVHRTGHNLGHDVHGNGVHFDNLETHDTRIVIPGICCTIEPGVYLRGELGVRSEINIYVTEQGPQVTTPPQSEVLALTVG